MRLSKENRIEMAKEMFQEIVANLDFEYLDVDLLLDDADTIQEESYHTPWEEAYETCLRKAIAEHIKNMADDWADGRNW